MEHLHAWLKRIFSFEIRWINHLFFWLFILLFFTFLPTLYLEAPFYKILLYNLLYIPADMASVYFTLYILVPRYLINGKPLHFFAGIAIVSVINYLVIILLFIRPVLEPLVGLTVTYGHWIKEFLDSFVMLTFIIGLATVLKILRYYSGLRLEKMKLEKINLQSELKMLRSQVTPHFLFNVLNNIDELIYEDRDKASEAIFRFSGLLRKLLREMAQEWIPLEEELNHVRDFVELMRLGFRSPAFLSIEIAGDPLGLLVPPMILMPVIENTFKHAERKTPDPGIIISLEIGDHSLLLTTRNTIRKRRTASDDSGTGLFNLRKRLEYLYPGKHSLETSRTGQVFITELKLEWL